jgi:hypothetical protein
MVGRKRALSQRGCELFSVCYGNNVVIKSKRRHSCLPDLKTLYQKLMTSDFDIKLEQHRKKMKRATEKMFTFLDTDKRHHIGTLINNAMTNLIIFTLSNGEKTVSKQKVKMNMSFYISLASKLYDEGDHHSAIIIRAAMSSFYIERLKIKLNDRQKEIYEKFKNEYGTFLNMHSYHLEKILKLNTNNYKTFYPSLMVLMTHLNKTREYAKCYEKMGKFPSKLRNKESQLENIAKLYFNKYKNTNELLLELYNTDPLDHPIMENYNCYDDKHITAALHEMSHNIVKASKKTPGLKRTKTKPLKN